MEKEKKSNSVSVLSAVLITALFVISIVSGIGNYYQLKKDKEKSEQIELLKSEKEDMIQKSVENYNKIQEAITTLATDLKQFGEDDQSKIIQQALNGLQISVVKDKNQNIDTTRVN